MGIDEDYSHKLRIALQWLALSARPMRLEEIAEAVSITLDTPPTFDPQNRLFSPANVLLICSSLITLTKRVGRMDLEESEEVEEL